MNAPSRSEPVTLVTSSPTWYGSHSGYYEQLVKALEKSGPISVMRPSGGLAARVAGKAYAIAKGMPQRDQRLTLLEARAKRVVDRNPRGVVHFTNLEPHLPFLSYWDKAPKNLFATIHFPPSRWTESDLALLSRCASAILLYRADVGFFERYVGEGRVRPILHGVDLGFFAPESADRSGPPRVLFCGQYLRDFDMLACTVRLVQSKRPEVQFDLVIAKHVHSFPALAGLAGTDGVHWHTGLSDTELRDTYRRATVAAFPLLDCGANNAVVECLACGAPMVATDVGGIRDFGGGSIFPLVPAGDAEAMAGRILELIDDPDTLNSIASNERSFAEANLSWETVALQHLDAYCDLAGEDLPTVTQP